jgi:hypothetical protein
MKKLLFIAGLFLATMTANAQTVPQQNVKETHTYLEIYTVRMKAETGQILDYVYSPNIAFNQGLLDALRDVLGNPYDGLLPAVANEVAAPYYNYIASGFNVHNPASLDWTNFLNIINTIVPGETVKLYVGNDSEGQEITQNQSVINSLIRTDPYEFLTSQTTGTEYAYVNGVLKPITTVINNYDNVDIKQLRLFKATTDGTNGVEDVVLDNALKARVENATLTVSGLTAGEQWSVYNTAGVQIHQSIAATDKATATLPLRGVYIVKQGNNVLKTVY